MGPPGLQINIIGRPVFVSEHLGAPVLVVGEAVGLPLLKGHLAVHLDTPVGGQALAVVLLKPQGQPVQTALRHLHLPGDGAVAALPGRAAQDVHHHASRLLGAGLGVAVAGHAQGAVVFEEDPLPFRLEGNPFSGGGVALGVIVRLDSGIGRRLLGGVQLEIFQQQRLVDH